MDEKVLRESVKSQEAIVSHYQRIIDEYDAECTIRCLAITDAKIRLARWKNEREIADGKIAEAKKQMRIISHELGFTKARPKISRLETLAAQLKKLQDEIAETNKSTV